MPLKSPPAAPVGVLESLNLESLPAQTSLEPVPKSLLNAVFLLNESSLVSISVC